MKCSQLLFGAVSLGVVVLVYLTTTAHCEPRDSEEHSGPIIHTNLDLVTEWINTHNLTMVHNLTEGERLPNDKLLYNETIIQEQNVYLPYVWEHIRWPNQFYEGEDYIVNYYSVIDMGYMGMVRVNAGGLGYEFVDFYVQAQDDSPYVFHVLIYGHRPKNGV